jgi:hypothetical protein
MKRTDMSTLHNIPLMVREMTPAEQAEVRGDYVALCRAGSREMVAMVKRDDLFDPHGNRFANN